MKDHAKRTAYLLLAIIVVVVLVTKVATAAEPFKGTLKTVAASALSGAESAIGSGLIAGFVDYVRYRNEEKGGIEGYKLDVQAYDTKMDVSIIVPATKRFSQELDIKVMYNSLSGFFPGAIDVANESKFAVMALSGTLEQAVLTKADELAGKKNYVFFHTPITQTRMASAIELIKKIWAEEKKEGVPRVASYNWDVSAGRVAARAAEHYCKRVGGVEYVGSTWHTTAPVDAIAQAGNIKRWRTDYVVGVPTHGGGQALLIKELSRVGSHAKLVHHMSLGPVYLETKDPIYEGHMTYQYAAGWDEVNVPEVALMRQMNQKWYKEIPERSNYYPVGWSAGRIFCEALAIGVKKYGMNLTGPNMLDAFESIKDLDMNGLTPKISYNRWDHQGNHGLRWVRCEKGKLVPIADIEAPPLSDEMREPEFWKEK